MPTQTAQLFIDTERTIGEISPLLFGGFAEHMGRCIYGGIYEPNSPHADESGLRTDVLEALRELDFSVMRYPGGNFLSGYDWRDGVGPRAQRPRRRELAWQSTETNQFGTNEFIDFCRAIDTEPMLGVNLGTGTVQAASDLVEYCNATVGTTFADLRAQHGHREPHGVEYWCLGNEMDGPWQIAHLDMHEYAVKAREAAKMMKWQDSSVKLVLCGSSNDRMPTYPEWDRVALETCWEQVDYHSMHYYATNHEDDADSFLASAVALEDFVETLAGTLRYVKAKRRSSHDVYLSWDEWNVWYKNREMRGSWAEAPHLIEEVYNLEDALVVAQWLNVFLRRCDVLKIACLAQIVNVIAPILTTRDDLLKQTIFYPFWMTRRLARGRSLDVLVQSPQHETAKYGRVPLLDVAASYDEASGRSALFLVNRSQTDAVAVAVQWQREGPQQVEEAWQLAGNDVKQSNSFAQPNALVARPIDVPALEDGALELRLPPLSFTTLGVR